MGRCAYLGAISFGAGVDGIEEAEVVGCAINEFGLDYDSWEELGELLVLGGWLGFGLGGGGNADLGGGGGDVEGERGRYLMDLCTDGGEGAV